MNQSLVTAMGTALLSLSIGAGCAAAAGAPDVQDSTASTGSVQQAQGSTGSSGGGGGGGGAALPQVAGTWRGQLHYDASLSIYFQPSQMNPPVAMAVSEDATGALTGTDLRMGIPITGKASSNGTIVIQDGTYYGTKDTMTLSGSVLCADGSLGSVMSGTFHDKEAFGTIALDDCPL
jgi:hypothetical protein